MATDSSGLIKHAQIAWAKRHGIPLVKGSPATKEPPLYVRALKDNLFEPLSPESHREYEQGSGTPLASKDGCLPHLHATHNSDAIAANVFHYWKTRNPSRMAYYLEMGTRSPRIPTVHFEQKFPILSRGTPPNIDVAIRHQNGCCCDWLGIESKLTETYPAERRKLFDHKYFDSAVNWDGLEQTKKLAESFRGDGKQQEQTKRHLDRGQLIKHLLGLRNSYRQHGDPQHARLVYLWYDVGTEESRKHQLELKEFAAHLQNDKVRFQAMTWQDLISRIAEGERANHGQYVEYLLDRYLS